jgi:hypothetical protein
MSDIYRKYFKIIDGPLIDDLLRIRAVRDAAIKEYVKIMDRLGAKTTTWMESSRGLAGIFFDNRPDDKLFKQVDGAWYPKQNSKAGKALHAEIRAVVYEHDDNALHVVGLKKGPSLYSNGHVHFINLIVVPSDSPVAFVNMPWRDVDPEKLKKYTFGDGDNDMDCLLWKPHASMKGIKHWELEKDLDEWNGRERIAS